jgi:hypothetical protein
VVAGAIVGFGDWRSAIHGHRRCPPALVALPCDGPRLRAERVGEPRRDGIRSPGATGRAAPGQVSGAGVVAREAASGATGRAGR